MALKLFRSTEYSSSSLFTHSRPLAGVGAATLMVVSSIWLAVPGNLALWQAVAGGASSAGGAALAVALAVAIAAFNCALLSLLGWGRLFKLSIILLFALAAIGTWSLLAQGVGGALPWPAWQRVLAVVVLFLLPLLVVLRQRVRITGLRRRVASNVIVLGASLTVLAGVLAVAGQNLQALVSYEPGWACMINPAAPVLKLTGQCTFSVKPV